MSPNDPPLRRIEEKLDLILERQAKHDTRLAVHEEKLQTLEENQKGTGGKLWAVVGMVLAATIGAVVNELTRLRGTH